MGCVAEVQAQRVALIGDLGGHADELRRLLGELGVGFDGEDLSWPTGLHIVQVGDLIHRGPDSLGVVLLVDRLLELGVWTQLVGNHEQQYVDRPAFQWPEVIDPAAADRLRTWWGDGRMVPAAVVQTDAEGDWLATHAGLTAGFWRHLGGPTSAFGLLESLDAATAAGTLWHPGLMLTGSPAPDAGPVWAEAGLEVYASWLASPEPSPLHQVHGHSSAFWWEREHWCEDPQVRRRLRVDEHLRHVTFTDRGRRLLGIDPGHGHTPAPAQAPLILTDARVITG